MNTVVVVTLIGLILVIAGHITVIARWSGRIDGYMESTTKRIENAENEILRLRNARHEADVHIQRHAGAIRELERRRSEGAPI